MIEMIILVRSHRFGMVLCKDTSPVPIIIWHRFRTLRYLYLKLLIFVQMNYSVTKTYHKDL
jgi:hypothetical protein